MIHTSFLEYWSNQKHTNKQKKLTTTTTKQVLKFINRLLVQKFLISLTPVALKPGQGC